MTTLRQSISLTAKEFLSPAFDYGPKELKSHALESQMEVPMVGSRKIRLNPQTHENMYDHVYGSQKASVFAHHKSSLSSSKVGSFLIQRLYVHLRKAPTVWLISFSLVQMISLGLEPMRQNFPLNWGVFVTPNSLLIYVIVFLVLGLSNDSREQLVKSRVTKAIDGRFCVAYDSLARCWSHMHWADLQAGQVVYLEEGDFVPADMVILSSSRPQGEAFFEDYGLSGQMDLCEKKAITKSESTQAALDAASSLRGRLLFDVARYKAEEFVGTLHLEGHPRATSVYEVSFVERGCKLVQTQSICGIITSTGPHVRSSATCCDKDGVKMCMLSRPTHLIFVLGIVVQITAVFICVGGYLIALPGSCAAFYTAFHAMVLAPLQINLTFITFAYMAQFATASCLLVWILLEALKLLHSLVLTHMTVFTRPFSGDLSLRGKATCLNSNVHGTLGACTIIMMDKTGVLTVPNASQIEACVIGGRLHNRCRGLRSFPRRTLTTLPSCSRVIPRRTVTDFGHSAAWRDPDMVEFFKASLLTSISLCSHANIGGWAKHHVASGVEDDIETLDRGLNQTSLDQQLLGQKFKYSSVQSDETCFLGWSRQLGLEFFGRSDCNVWLKENAQIIKYDLLCFRGFSRERSHITVVVKPGTNAFSPQLYCRGTLKALMPYCSKMRGVSRWKAWIRDFHQRLIVEVNLGWKRDYCRLEGLADSLSTESPQFGEALHELEADLEILGIAILKDKLAANIGATLQGLRTAQRNVWMITGDTYDTALRVAYGTRFITRTTKVYEPFRVRALGLARLRHRLKSMVTDVASETPSRPTALILTGEGWEKALRQQDTQFLLFRMIVASKVVICAEMTPTHKAQFVSSLRTSLTPEPLIAVVGDGLNDALAMQVAHVGILVENPKCCLNHKAREFADIVVSSVDLLPHLFNVYGPLAQLQSRAATKWTVFQMITVTLPNLMFASYTCYSATPLTSIWAITRTTAISVAAFLLRCWMQLAWQNTPNPGQSVSRHSFSLAHFAVDFFLGLVCSSVACHLCLKAGKLMDPMPSVLELGQALMLVLGVQIMVYFCVQLDPRWTLSQWCTVGFGLLLCLTSVFESTLKFVRGDALDPGIANSVFVHVEYWLIFALSSGLTFTLSQSDHLLQAIFSSRQIRQQLWVFHLFEPRGRAVVGGTAQPPIKVVQEVAKDGPWESPLCSPPGSVFGQSFHEGDLEPLQGRKSQPSVLLTKPQVSKRHLSFSSVQDPSKEKITWRSRVSSELSAASTSWAVSPATFQLPHLTSIELWSLLHPVKLQFKETELRLEYEAFRRQTLHTHLVSYRLRLMCVIVVFLGTSLLRFLHTREGPYFSVQLVLALFPASFLLLLLATSFYTRLFLEYLDFLIGAFFILTGLSFCVSNYLLALDGSDMAVLLISVIFAALDLPFLNAVCYASTLACFHCISYILSANSVTYRPFYTYRVPNWGKIEVLSMPFLMRCVPMLAGNFVMTAIVCYQNNCAQHRSFLIHHQAQLVQNKQREILYAMLPEFAVHLMLTSKELVPDIVDQTFVSVLFCDIHQFHFLVGSVSPTQLVRVLDALFLCFDKCAEQLVCTKIETVFDTYLAAAGLNRGGKQRKLSEDIAHAVDALNALSLGLAMLKVVQYMPVELDRAIQSQTHLQLDIGLHSGEVLTGIVGKKKPQYALVGDTVNTASRMKSTGEPGVIHVSEATHALLTEYPQFKWDQQTVQVKGKGAMTTFLLRDVVEDHIKSSPPPSKRSLSRDTLAESDSSIPRRSPRCFPSSKMDPLQKDSLLIKPPPLGKFSLRFRYCALENEFKRKLQASDETRLYPRHLLELTLVFFAAQSFIEYAVPRVYPDGQRSPLSLSLWVSQTVIFGAFAVLWGGFTYGTGHKRSIQVYQCVYLAAEMLAILAYPTPWTTENTLQVMFYWTMVNHHSTFLFRHVLWVNIFLVTLLGIHLVATSPFVLVVCAGFFCVHVLSCYCKEYECRVFHSTKNVMRRIELRSQDLLQSMLPSEVLREFQQEKLRLAYVHEHMSFLFADICGFTAWAKNVQPIQVVQLLQELFGRFDENTTIFGLYKLCTIGDAYVAITEPSSTTKPKETYVKEAAQILHMAEAMISDISCIRHQFQIEDLNLRVGIHFGQCVGGVIGSGRLRYDIWGVDVVTGNLIETHGIPGCICVSGPFRDLVEEPLSK